MAKLYFIGVCSFSVLLLVYSEFSFIAPLIKGVSKAMLLKIK